MNSTPRRVVELEIAVRAIPESSFDYEGEWVVFPEPGEPRRDQRVDWPEGGRESASPE